MSVTGILLPQDSTTDVYTVCHWENNHETEVFSFYYRFYNIYSYLYCRTK